MTDTAEYDFDGMAEIPNDDVTDYKPPTEEDLKQDDESLPRGYMTKEAWTASGKDPKDWVSEDVFKERGEHIKHTMAMRREFENQIKNLTLFHQVQLKNQREELLSKRDDAIEVADKAAVKAIDKQIKELDDIERLNTPVPSPANSKAPEILEWEAENPWSQNPADPRLKLANRVFQEATAAGKSYYGALKMVDAAIAAKFSEKSGAPRQIAEGSRSAGGNRSSAESVTMKTLTRAEQQVWDTGLFSDEKTFLKAVANDRKGAK